MLVLLARLFYVGDARKVVKETGFVWREVY